MDKRELELIKELMDKLSDEMEYGEEDFAERLGRKNPEIEVIKMEGEMPLEDEDMEDEDMEEDSMEPEMEDEESSPEEELKRRIMKMRE